MPRRLTAEDVEDGAPIDEYLRAELEEEDDDLDDDVMYDVQGGKLVPVAAAKPNTQGQQTSLKASQPNREGMDSKVLKKIHLDEFSSGGGGGGTGGAKMNKQVISDLQDAVDRGAHRAAAAKKLQGHDRAERATVESVLDPRTRLILYKLVNSGLLTEINGCVSTGKEAHVYYAKCGEGDMDAAVKVYNTSVLVFKDRERYVSGEFRFQNYCKSNPRKMVKTWAEKEARNLARLANGGINVPKVILLRQHVLVMEFLGVDGWPAPKLKDVKFSETPMLQQCYIDLVAMMRRMYRTCRLVHGDLSEYNLLFHKQRVVMIDVSQSVEHDHPESIAFLRRDVVNVNRFFRLRGLGAWILSLNQLFFAVTAETEVLEAKAPEDPTLGDPNLVPKLNRLSRSTSLEEDTSAVLAYVRRCANARRAAMLAAAKEEGASLAADSYLQEESKFLEVMHRTGPKEEDALKAKKKSAQQAASDDDGSDEEEREEDEDSAEESEEEGDEESEGASTKKGASGGPTLAEMTKEERKAWQKKVKEEKREKRMNDKIPKHKKRRACAQHKKK